MKHFLSDEYEIHPQLKDYKLQAFSEMVNDLIVARPDEEAYTIKDVSQKQTGMCAAISIARKTIAYEDKVRAMEIMMNELDATPTMTELKSERVKWLKFRRHTLTSPMV